MILGIIITITFCIIIYNIKYRHLINPYKLYMIFGKKGSGKSTYLVALATKYIKQKYAVYTNMTDCNVPGIRIIDPEKLGEYVPQPKSVLLLDESGILFDNRNFKSFKPATRDFFKLQRHYESIVYLASQSFDIDKKLRDLTDKMYLIQSVTPWISLIRPIRKSIALVEASEMGESRIADNLKFEWIFSWKFNFIPRYMKYFNSFVAPQKPEIPYEMIKA